MTRVVFFFLRPGVKSKSIFTLDLHLLGTKAVGYRARSRRTPSLASVNIRSCVIGIVFRGEKPPQAPRESTIVPSKLHQTALHATDFELAIERLRRTW